VEAARPRAGARHVRDGPAGRALADASAFFEPGVWARLREVKAQYDPADLFVGSHHIPPASP
jgi:hypothetical protein